MSPNGHGDRRAAQNAPAGVPAKIARLANWCQLVGRGRGNFAGTPPVALLGVSPMTRRCAVLLHESKIPLIIVNRTPQAASELAASVGAEWLPLAEFRLQPPAVSALMLAAGG